MPLQQFDERLLLQIVVTLDDTAVPNTFTTWSSSTPRDSRIDQWIISNSDVVDHHVPLDFNNVGDAGVAAELVIPARAGYDGNRPFDVLGFVFPSTSQYFMMPASDGYQWCVREAIGAGCFVVMFWQAGQF